MDYLLDEFIKRSQDILKDNLVGVYLHGSAVMGCYNPVKSDIDLIVVIKDNMTDDVKRAVMDMVVELNAFAPEKGIEMSIVNCFMMRYGNIQKVRRLFTMQSVP